MAVRGAVTRKYIFDPVHGPIELSGLSLALVGHPLVQRLWGIRQTGLAQLVFPGANHTRLEHSLGVLFLARAMSEAMELPEREAHAISIAGLLHDLGHTPYSHTLEPVLRELTGRSHEDMTRALVEGEPLAGFRSLGERLSGSPSEELPTLLERHGIPPRELSRLLGPQREGGKPYVGEMLHGAIDADRVDYLERDARYTGVGPGIIDAHRLLETARRVDGHLAFEEKGRAAVEGFLLARSLMYSSVYYNKTVRIAEMMLQGAVERWPGARSEPWYAWTDGDLLCRLKTSEGVPGELARRLEVRQLYKRVATLDRTDAPFRELSRLVRDPAARRAWEEELSSRLRARPGELLIDLAQALPVSASPRSRRPPDPVWVLRNGQRRDLYRDDPIWAAWALRPVVPWAAAMYVSPRLRRSASTRATRWLGDPP